MKVSAGSVKSDLFSSRGLEKQGINSKLVQCVSLLALTYIFRLDKKAGLMRQRVYQLCKEELLPIFQRILSLKGRFSSSMNPTEVRKGRALPPPEPKMPLVKNRFFSEEGYEQMRLRHESLLQVVCEHPQAINLIVATEERGIDINTLSEMRLPKEWLLDTVLCLYLYKMSLGRDDVLVWEDTLSRFDGIQEGKFGEFIRGGKGLILIPLSPMGHHSLLVIDTKGKGIRHFDSISGYHSHFPKQVRLKLKKMFPGDWKLLEGGSAQQGANGTECGVFTCWHGMKVLEQFPQRSLEEIQVLGEDALHLCECGQFREKIYDTIIKGASIRIRESTGGKIEPLLLESGEPYRLF